MKSKKEIGDSAEKFVCSNITSCPRCKRGKLRRLPPNFPCADIICCFCGYLAQVKAHTVTDWENVSLVKLPGATWEVQKERVQAGIYFPIYVVLYLKDRPVEILYLSVDHQVPRMFRPRRKPQHGAQRFDYRFDWETKRFFVQVYERSPVEDERGRIRLAEVSEASFTQLPEKKRWTTPR